MSAIQLDLLDTAHVVPVETKNGIYLSAIHHRAFDPGLVSVRRNYSVVVNERRLGELKSLAWDGGIGLFKSTLRDQILVPVGRRFYPDLEYLVFGQTLRGWDRRALVLGR